MLLGSECRAQVERCREPDDRKNRGGNQADLNSHQVPVEQTAEESTHRKDDAEMERQT